MMDLLTQLAPVASIVVSLLALVVVFRVEHRNQKRFETQLEQSREIAAANLRPLLSLRSQIYVNQKGVSLENFGVGTAVISSIEFFRDGEKPTRHLVELFESPDDYAWDTFWRFSTKRYYLAAGTKHQLVKLTSANLIGQGCSEERALKLLEAWQSQKSGIRVRVRYEDVLDNRQEALDEVLH